MQPCLALHRCRVCPRHAAGAPRAGKGVGMHAWHQGRQQKCTHALWAGRLGRMHACAPWAPYAACRPAPPAPCPPAPAPPPPRAWCARCGPRRRPCPARPCRAAQAPCPARPAASRLHTHTCSQALVDTAGQGRACEPARCVLGMHMHASNRVGEWGCHGGKQQGSHPLKRIKAYGMWHSRERSRRASWGPLTGGTEGAIMAACADHHARLHHVGVHAALAAMSLGHQRPVGDHACACRGTRT